MCKYKLARIKSLIYSLSAIAIIFLLQIFFSSIENSWGVLQVSPNFEYEQRIQKVLELLKSLGFDPVKETYDTFTFISAEKGLSYMEDDIYKGGDGSGTYVSISIYPSNQSSNIGRPGEQLSFPSGIAYLESGSIARSSSDHGSSSAEINFNCGGISTNVILFSRIGLFDPKSPTEEKT